MSIREAVHIDAGGVPYRELNERVRRALQGGARDISLVNVQGQRYIGAGLSGAATIAVNGVPGNNLACFMSGPRITVNGNAQDGVANTMSAGTVVIHGGAGDVLAYSMRGGKVFVRGDAGYRVGIHMKAFRDRSPVVVIGGSVKDYLGEYMAGGTLAVLGLDLPDGQPLAGEFVGTGMHGGDMFLRGRVDGWQLGEEVGVVEIDDRSWSALSGHLCGYSREFGLDPAWLRRDEFTRLRPVSHRPYGKIYVY